MPSDPTVSSRRQAVEMSLDGLHATRGHERIANGKSRLKPRSYTMICGLKLAGMLSAILIAAAGTQAKLIELPTWMPPADAQRIPFFLEPGGSLVRVWGRGQELPRVYFDELLPALFDRTLAVDKMSPGDGRLEWIFTGDRGGLTIVVDGSHVKLFQRYYDSVGFNEQKSGKSESHPEWCAPPATVTYQGNLRR